MEIRTSYQIAKQLKQNKSYMGLSLSRYANLKWVAVDDIIKELKIISKYICEDSSNDYVEEVIKQLQGDIK